MSDARGVYAQVEFWKKQHHDMFLKELYDVMGLLRDDQIADASDEQLCMHGHALEHLHNHKTY